MGWEYLLVREHRNASEVDVLARKKSVLPMRLLMKTMSFTRIVTAARMLLALLGFSAASSAETVRLYFDSATPQIAFAAGDIKDALEKQKHTVQTHDLAGLAKAAPGMKIVLAVATDNTVASLLAAQGGKPAGELDAQAYALCTTTAPDLSYWVLGGDPSGAMYGGLQLAETIQFNGFGKPYNDVVSPRILRRGAKLNFALDERLPTYSGRFHTSSAMSVKAVWDMSFWKEWIDEQARNRCNLLTVWIHNPFPALVEVPGFEKATLPNIKGQKGHDVPGGDALTLEKRIAFGKQVMRHARDRGRMRPLSASACHAMSKEPSTSPIPGSKW